MEASQPALAGDGRSPNLTTIELITIRSSAARSAGFDLFGCQPGVPLRFTLGFMLPPAPQVGCISSSDFRDPTPRTSLPLFHLSWPSAFSNSPFAVQKDSKAC